MRLVLPWFKWGLRGVNLYVKTKMQNSQSTCCETQMIESGNYIFSLKDLKEDKKFIVEHSAHPLNNKLIRVRA